MRDYRSICLVCGDVTEPDQFQCPEHIRARLAARREAKGSTREQGRAGLWMKLSKRARQMQPFCTDCGATWNLQADHLPSAWLRWERRLPIRLEDVEVTCGPCNIKRGSSKPGTPRYEAWVRANG